MSFVHYSCVISVAGRGCDHISGTVMVYTLGENKRSHWANIICVCVCALSNRFVYHRDNWKRNEIGHK